MRARLFTVFRGIGDKEETRLPQIGYTRDVSAGGAYFYFKNRVDQGEEVSLTIHLTTDWAEGGKPPKLEGDGKILRVEENRKSFPLADFSGVAVQFAHELAVSF